MTQGIVSVQSIHQQVAPGHIATTDGGLMGRYAKEGSNVKGRTQDDLLKHPHGKDPTSGERKQAR